MLLRARESVEEILEWVREVQELGHLLLFAHGLVVEVKKKKKDQRKRSTTWKEQSIQRNTISRRHIIRPVFKKTVPMSNFDLLEWCQYLEIHIKNVLSRDQTVPHNHKLSLFIYNLEPSYMNGSHWVATYVRDRVINYFDSFGMAPFREIVHRAKEQNLTLLHQNRQIQNLYTTTCGYFFLYFLNEMHKGKKIYFDLLGVFSADTNKN